MCNSLDWPTLFSLLKYTVLFHATNMVGGARNDDSKFPARLRIVTGSDIEILIRPFAGDLFVLFEVLMDGCYHIPDVILRPEEARIILDCGGRICRAVIRIAISECSDHQHRTE